MPKARKGFGKLPETVVVLNERVAFDENGWADVSDAVAEVLRNVPGYEVEGEGSSSKGGASASVADEGIAPAPAAPVLPKRKAPSAKK